MRRARRPAPDRAPGAPGAARPLLLLVLGLLAGMLGGAIASSIAARRRARRAGDAADPRDADLDIATLAPSRQARAAGVVASRAAAGRRAAAASPAAVARGARRPVLRTAAATLLVLLLTSIPASSALLADLAGMAPVAVDGGSVEVPTGLAVVQGGMDADLTWTAPATGLAPDQYEYERRLLPAAFTGTATGTAPGTSIADTPPSACGETYGYRVRSAHGQLRSAWTGEQQVTMADETAPVVAGSVVVATSGPAPVADWLAAGGQYYVYANVDDDCDADADLTVQADVGAGNVAMTLGSFTPVAAGPTWEYRAGPFTAGALADGATFTWTVSATDTTANATTVAGTTATVDAVAPVIASTPQLVATATNYYAPEVGRGAVQPTGTYYVYSDASDARSGLASVTSDTTGFTTGATATSLASGAFTVDNGVGFGWRTAAVAATGGTGTAVPFAVTATDLVGNATTVGGTADKDATGPSWDFAYCTAVNLAGANNTLANGDAFDFRWGEAIDPASLVGGWSGTGAQATSATVVDGTGNNSDFMTFALPITQGNTVATAFDLQNKQWVAADVAFGSSTVSRVDERSFRLVFGGGGTADKKGNNSTFYAGTTPTDVAGNAAIAASGACSIGW